MNTAMTKLERALSYRRRGWWVIPVNGKSPKKPLGEGWQDKRLINHGYTLGL